MNKTGFSLRKASYDIPVKKEGIVNDRESPYDTLTWDHLWSSFCSIYSHWNYLPKFKEKGLSLPFAKDSWRIWFGLLTCSSMELFRVYGKTEYGQKYKSSKIRCRKIGWELVLAYRNWPSLTRKGMMEGSGDDVFHPRGERERRGEVKWEKAKGSEMKTMNGTGIG